jgi:hypothetical protein
MITSWKVHHLSYVCMNIQENPVYTNSFSTMWQNLLEKGQLLIVRDEFNAQLLPKQSGTQMSFPCNK